MLGVLLFLMLLLLFPLIGLLLVPYSFALISARNLLTLPAQMLAVAFDKGRRRNHALEHATVNILEQRYARRLPMGGFAVRDGFLIHGVAQPDAVLSAAHEGLERLRAGETQLALHPRCGTIVVSGQLISAVVFVIVLLLLKSLTFASLLLAMVAAIVAAKALARPVGMLLQRLTTSTDMQGLQIDRLDVEMPRHPFALILSGGQPTQFRLWTQQIEIEAPGPKRYKAY